MSRFGVTDGQSRSISYKSLDPFDASSFGRIYYATDPYAYFEWYRLPEPTWSGTDPNYSFDPNGTLYNGYLFDASRQLSGGVDNLAPHGVGHVSLIMPNTTAGNSDQIFMMGSPDIVYAGPGDDSILGNGGGDTLVGGSGDDSIDAGDGDDTIYGDWTEEPLYKTQNLKDNVLGDINTLPDWSTLPAEDTTLTGSDILKGGAGSDTIYGGPGGDLIDGGVRGDGYTDILTGGPGPRPGRARCTSASWRRPCRRTSSPGSRRHRSRATSGLP